MDRMEGQGEGARVAHRRAHVIAQHLNLEEAQEQGDGLDTIHTAAAAKATNKRQNGRNNNATNKKKKTPVRDLKLEKSDLDNLTELLYPDHRELRSKIFDMFKDPIFKPVYNVKMEEFRELTLQRLQCVSSNKLFRLREVFIDATILIALQETLAFMDMSLSVKAGVQWGLFGGSVASLGTEKHFDMLDRCESLDVRGCFALTELGHGSNARGIETEAIYVPETQEFVINSPTPTSQKYWIGNVACHGTWATVFANLILPGGRNEGFHAFLVPIRGEDGRALPGVGIGDCGYKMGLNGVDNGRLWFNNVRVPLDNLLNKYGDVSPDGSYHTHIPNKGKRFNTMLDALVGGRICVGSSALNVSKLGLTIAVRYACTRRQFGIPKNPEFLLMDYLSHQRRLLPLVATTYALRFGMNYTKNVLRDLQSVIVAGTLSEEDEIKKRELFLLASGFKAVSTWHRAETLQLCRECCGGQGFAAVNQIGMFKNDADIDLTYEGDNTILMQAVARTLLQEFYSSFTGKQRLTNIMGYLKGQLGILVRSKNPMMRRYAGEAHLLDLDFYNDAFVWREFKLLRTIVFALRSKVRGQGMNPFDAWNSILDIIIDLGKAYVDRIACEKFVETIRGCKGQPTTRAVLKHLCRLWALSTLQRNMGWYVAHSYFAPVKARAMQAEINKLCNELRPHALSLVEGFALPDHVVCAPIASDWVEAGSQGYTNEKGEREKLLASLSSQVLGDIAYGDGRDEGEEYDVIYYEDVDVGDDEDESTTTSATDEMSHL